MVSLEKKNVHWFYFYSFYYRVPSTLMYKFYRKPRCQVATLKFVTLSIPHVEFFSNYLKVAMKAEI